MFVLTTWFGRVLGLLALGLVAAMWYFSHRLDQAALDKTTSVIIHKGSSTRMIEKKLQSHGVVLFPNELVLIEYLLGQDIGLLKAGTYELHAGITRRELLFLLQKGSNKRVWLTIPECLTSKEILALLMKDDRLHGPEPKMPKEGMLAPDTYDVAEANERQDIVDRLLKIREEQLSKIWQSRHPDHPLETKEQLLILASIVEKESGRGSEQDKIAAVFVNRLKKGMRLQSDPTVIYHLTNGMGKLGRPITRQDLRMDNPYNTYTRFGLTPSALCNPSVQALRATAQYDDTDALYFVADAEGGHWFARTLKEHLRNVQKYRRKVQQ